MRLFLENSIEKGCTPFTSLLAAEEGFEPSQTDPESGATITQFGNIPETIP